MYGAYGSGFTGAVGPGYGYSFYSPGFGMSYFNGPGYGAWGGFGSGF
jgi:hypothetical protein